MSDLTAYCTECKKSIPNGSEELYNSKFNGVLYVRVCKDCHEVDQNQLTQTK